MLKNYIKIAFRNLIRDRTFSILNLVGLSVGLACVIMILAYVRYELSYEKSYSNHNQVYRLFGENKTGNTDDKQLYLPMGLAQALQKEFPAINAFCVVNKGDQDFKVCNEIINLDEINSTVDFFKLFNFDFVKGNPATALEQPGSIVITQNVANKLFAGKDPIGANLTETGGKIRHVTAVIKNLPANSHLKGDVIASLSGEKSTEEVLNWQAYSSAPQYLLLNKQTDAKKLEEQFSSIYKKYKFPTTVTLHLQAVTDVHLRSHLEDEISTNSDIKYVYIFSFAALLILFIACINYINLSTARSLQRAKEIGLRKVLGALRPQLIIQFLTESFLFFIISTLSALFIAAVAWPIFSARITSYGTVIPLFDSTSAVIIVLIFVSGGLFAGAYPAFFLSSLQPVKMLKGLSKFGLNLSLRKALVVLQFTISGVLIISTIIVYQQLSFISNSRLGFNKDNLVTMPYYVKNAQITSFRHELTKNPDIKDMTVAGWRIGMHYGASSSMADAKDTNKVLKFQFIDVDPDFIKTMDIHLIEGRNFSLSHSNDMLAMDSLFKLPRPEFNKAMSARSIIVNQEAAALLELSHPRDTMLNTGAVQGTVIGVVQNFNGLTLHQKIPAVIIRCSATNTYGQMFIRISPHNTQKTINYIEGLWKTFYPNSRFDFAFADDKLQKLYTADRRLGSIFVTFATLAVVIGCLGLFGLISLTVQNRVKEIGIRKVLGANVLNITRLISTDFIKLVVISLVISSPIAWYAMNKWLQDFAYRINIEWWVFVLAGGVAVFIALATVSFQSIKAALANPVKSLKNE